MNNINAPFGTLALEEYQSENVEYIRPIDEGFCEIPKQAVTSFHPPLNHTQRVFATVIYYDGEGDRKFLGGGGPTRFFRFFRSRFRQNQLSYRENRETVFRYYLPP